MSIKLKLEEEERCRGNKSAQKPKVELKVYDCRNFSLRHCSIGAVG